MENKYKNSSAKPKNKNSFGAASNPSGKQKNGNKQTRSRVLSLAQLLNRVRKQRSFSGGFAGQGNANTQSGGASNTQTRNMQLGTNQKVTGSYSFGNSFYESKGKAKTYGEQGLNFTRDKAFSYSGGMTKAQIRMESQKEDQRRQKSIKPIIPPKSLVIILREKPEKILYNRRIIDYKHCGLLQRYIGLGGKILPRRQTRLTAKQQRYIAKTIKSARIMGLLPFVSKEKGFFR